MRAIMYEITGLLLMVLSLYFFYRSVDFLTINDYISAVISMLIGFIMIRGGVDLTRVAMFVETERAKSTSSSS